MRTPPRLATTLALGAMTGFEDADGAEIASEAAASSGPPSVAGAAPALVEEGAAPPVKDFGHWRGLLLGCSRGRERA
eukprot:730380-Pyramimonas_sp.AAC.1